MNYPYARHDTNIRSQPYSQTTGTMPEAWSCYFDKQKLHDYKFKASVLSIGVRIGCISHARGRRFDLEIIPSRKHLQFAASTKKEIHSLENDRDSCEYFGNLWAIIVDKRYQDINEFLRGKYPMKIPRYQNFWKVQHVHHLRHKTFGIICVQRLISDPCWTRKVFPHLMVLLRRHAIVCFEVWGIKHMLNWTKSV